MVHLTKTSYARGICEQLQSRGLVAFDSVENMKLASAHAADLITTEPQVAGVSNADVMKVASQLISLSNGMRAQGKFASYPQAVTMRTSVEAPYADLIYKIAEATTMESLSTGDAHLVNNVISSPTDPAALMENQARPPGYAVLPEQGMGNFSEPTAARIGQEMMHPGAANDALGRPTNSVIEASKAASAQDMLIRALTQKRSMEMGSPLSSSHPHPQNTISNPSDPAALMENQARPAGYATLPSPGMGNFSEPTAARIGMETPHPGAAQDAAGRPNNSVTEASKAAHWVRLSTYMDSKLSPAIPPETKTACINEAMTMSGPQIDQYINTINARFTGPTAGSVFNALR